MAVTLDELKGSQKQLLFNILFLNSPWLMSTWGDSLAEMAQKAVKISAENLEEASISVKKRQCKSKEKEWIVASCRVQCKEFTLLFDLPESFLLEEDEKPEDHQARLKAIYPALVGKIFAPRGNVDQNAASAI